MPKHISVATAMFIWLIAVILILIGFVSLFAGSVAGLGLIVFGFIIAGLNKLIFKVRTKQLEIDSREAIRDRFGNTCPNCGNRLPSGSSFCNKCGYKLLSPPPPP